MQAVENVSGQAVPIILQWGIAGVFLLILIYLVYKQWNYFIKKEEDSEVKFKNKDEDYKALAEKLMQHEKENINILNDLSNSFSNLAILIQDIKNKLDK